MLDLQQVKLHVRQDEPRDAAVKHAPLTPSLLATSQATACRAPGPPMVVLHTMCGCAHALQNACLRSTAVGVHTSHVHERAPRSLALHADGRFKDLVAAQARADASAVPGASGVQALEGATPMRSRSSRTRPAGSEARGVLTLSAPCAERFYKVVTPAWLPCTCAFHAAVWWPCASSWRWHWHCWG